MALTRVYVEADLASGITQELPPIAAHHLLHVLRARVGDDLIVFNGQGGEFAARVQSCSKRQVVIDVLDYRAVSRESPLAVTLAQGVSKGDRMDYVVQKAVELGVTRVVPLITQRSTVQLNQERGDKRLAHWRGIVISACEQSGRTRLPDVSPVQSLTTWLNTSGMTCGLVCTPTASSGLLQIPAPTTDVVLLVGPEGGLTETELALAQRQGYRAVTLGPRILRTETAPVAVIAALQMLWGDLGTPGLQTSGR